MLTVDEFRRADDVAAQLFQRLAVVRRAAHGGVQAEYVDVGAQGMLGASGCSVGNAAVN